MALKLFPVFCCIVLFKFLSNYTAYRKCKKYREEYIQWATAPDKHEYFTERRSEILNLMERASIPDSCIPVSQVISPMQMVSSATSVYANFPTKHPQLSASMYSKFNDAVGVYHLRWKEAFNPLYWIEMVVFLPKSLISYIGADLESPVLRLSNVLATAIWWIIIFLLYTFRGDLYNHILEFITQF